ncbi:hypothetical protein LTR86_007392 [Recurvomyces mirabilis]|nr:hypothetical protein LTR86_007392 [Recurvomyces mirabilis]
MPGPSRVAIIGGGIGGLACALFINHFATKADLDISIDVYEQSLEYKEIGAGVGIGPNAAKLLHHIGLGDELNAIAGDRNGVWISFRRFDNGEEIVTVPSKDDVAVRQAPVARSELLELFLHAIEQRKAAVLHTAKKALSIEVLDDSKAVRVNFADGHSATADLVVACDGIHSSIRNQFVQDKPTYSGRIVYRGVIPMSAVRNSWPLPSYSVSWLAKDSHFFVFPISRNESLNIVAFASKSEEDIGDLRESWTASCSRAEAESDFAHYDDVVRRTIASMPDRIAKWKLNDREPLDQWTYFDGKVVIMGDAAHAMLPHQGAGAGQSLEDGYILARSLTDCLRNASMSSTCGMKTSGLARFMHLYQTVRLP